MKPHELRPGDRVAWEVETRVLCRRQYLLGTFVRHGLGVGSAVAVVKQDGTGEEISVPVEHLELSPVSMHQYRFTGMAEQEELFG